MNQWNGVGRLTRDPEQMPNNGPVKFTLAAEEYDPPSKGRKAEFIDCGAWGKTGELLVNYVSKGQMIRATGRITNREYTDKQGNKRRATEIVVNDVELLGGGQNKPQTDSSDSSW